MGCLFMTLDLERDLTKGRPLVVALAAALGTYLMSGTLACAPGLWLAGLSSGVLFSLADGFQWLFWVFFLSTAVISLRW